MERTIVAVVSVIVLGLCIAFESGVSAGNEQAVVISPADRTGTTLVIYNNDLAFISETRSFERRAGIFRLEFSDVGRTIVPASVSVRPGSGLQVLEQQYDFDLISRHRLLASYIGRRIELERLDQRTQTRERLSGTLLSLDGGVIVQFEDHVAVDPQGTLIVPSVPEGMVTEPKLSWLVRSSGAGRSSLEVSYLAHGLSWQCDYLLELDKDGRATLTAWVTLRNNSGAAYRSAKLALVAGEVHSLPGGEPVPRLAGVETAMLAAKADVGVVSVEKGFEYYRYDLGRTLDLFDSQVKQVELFGHRDIKIEKIYRLEPNQSLYYRVAQGQERPLQADVLLEWENGGGNYPDMPLPAGTVRVYDRNAEPGMFLGEARIGHTPRDEKITVRAGSAFDVLGRRRQASYERLSDRLQRVTLEVELTNRSTGPVTVQVDELLPGDWKITESTNQWQKLDASRVRFSPQVPAGGKTTVRFTVEYI